MVAVFHMVCPHITAIAATLPLCPQSPFLPHCRSVPIFEKSSEIEQKKFEKTKQNLKSVQ
jgi:hypothetical protein